MKPAVALFLIAILATSCKSGQSNLKSDLESANLKGKVWKIDKTIHDANGRCACPAAMKTECNQSKYIYNKKGNLIESYTIDQDGNTNVSTKYVYNRRGLCIEIDKYSGEKLVGKEVPVLEGAKLTEYKIYNENGINETTFTYVYSGDEVSEEKTLNSNGEIVSSTQNEFLNGQLVTKTEKDSIGDVKSINKFRRNANNDITDYLIIIPKDNREYKFIYEYEYDNFGNWVKQTRFYGGQIESIVIRNIEYFQV